MVVLTRLLGFSCQIYSSSVDWLILFFGLSDGNFRLMTLSFLPGLPNNTPQSVCQKSWNDLTILVYCSGNNLIVLSNHSERLQTIYLPSDCYAVDINSCTGLIAAAINNEVYIYKPLHQVMKNPKWVYCTKIYHDDSQVNALSWGIKNELVVGSDYLSFWDVRDVFGEYKPQVLWTKKHPRPVYLCSLSSDSKFIASINYEDTNVKLWRRVSMAGDSGVFELVILPHPNTVTIFRWSTFNHECEKEYSHHVLYTLCADYKLRIWINFDVDCRRNVQLWGSIQLSARNKERFCMIMDDWLVQKSLQQISSEKYGSDKTVSYLLSKKPVLVILGSTDHKIRIFSVENVSSYPPKPVLVKELVKREIFAPTFGSAPEFLYISEPQLDDDKKNISLILHDLHGSVRHSMLNIPSLLLRTDQVGTLLHKWTGHVKSIQRLFRSSNGCALLTTSRFRENTVWTPLKLESSTTLAKKCKLFTNSPIQYALVHDDGDLIITLSEDYILEVWICPHEENDAILKDSLKIEGERGYPSLIVNTPEPTHNSNRHIFSLIYSDGYVEGYCYADESLSRVPCGNIGSIDETKVHLISSIDPVRYKFQSDRNLVATMTENGIIRIYRASATPNEITWSKSFQLNTNIFKASKIMASSNDKISVISEKGTNLTFWDLRRGVLEYETDFDDQVIDIDWTSTDLEQNIVAVGFHHYSILYTQLRYDYTNKNPSYLPIEKIDISQHTTHAIGDSTWLKGGTFVIASGNQLFVKDKTLDLRDKFTYQSIGSRKILSNDIMHLTSVLNGPLPLYHPQLLIQSLFAKKTNLVREILLKLFLFMREMEFTNVDIYTINSRLKLDPKKFLCPLDSQYNFDSYEEPYACFDGAVASLLIERLAKTPLPYLTRHQQVTLVSVIEAVIEINANEQIVDVNGVRFMLGVKLFTSHKNTQLSISMRDVNWAIHSDNKEILLANLVPRIKSWNNAKEYKIAYWCKHEDLVKQFDSIARLEFNGDDKRDPSKCAIFYLALKKKNILLGLWRISSSHPEQNKMLKFLQNDFSEARWRSAALKNAFVLLSKHRYMDAASFFLLAGSVKDAASVILKQLEDLDLAIAVLRVYEGDNGVALDEFLNLQLLPTAVLDNDRWTASYIYWKMRNQALAIKALVSDPVELDNNDKLIERNQCVNKSFLVEDPLLLQLYSQLRSRNLEYFRSALEIDSNLEYENILKVAAVYSRMGCDYLAIGLLRNWKFLDIKKINRETEEIPSFDTSKSTIHEEPSTTQVVRPSLFDKFGRQSLGSQESYIPKNLLDDFGAESERVSTPTTSPNPSETRNILDSFFDNSNAKNASSGGTTNFSTPDSDGDFNSNVKTTGTKTIDNSSTSNRNISPKKSPSSASNGLAKPKNLLDAFM